MRQYYKYLNKDLTKAQTVLCIYYRVAAHFLES